MLAITSYVQKFQKSQNSNQNEVKNISTEKLEENLQIKIEEAFNKKLEVIEQKLDAFLIKIEDNSEAHLTDYGTLMSRINRVEDLQASCCIFKEENSGEEVTASSRPPAKRLTTTSTLSTTTTLNTITSDTSFSRRPAGN